MCCPSGARGGGELAGASEASDRHQIIESPVECRVGRQSISACSLWKLSARLSRPGPLPVWSVRFGSARPGGTRAQGPGPILISWTNRATEREDKQRPPVVLLIGASCRPASSLRLDNGLADERPVPSRPPNGLASAQIRGPAPAAVRATLIDCQSAPAAAPKGQKLIFSSVQVATRARRPFSWPAREIDLSRRPGALWEIGASESRPRQRLGAL